MKRMLLPALVVLLVAACQPAMVRQGTPSVATLTGIVTDVTSSAPVEGAYVNVYKESNTHFFGPPNYFAPATDVRGAYRLELPPGKYFVVARKRQSGSYQGPLYKEDYFAEAQARAIVIGAGSNSLNMQMQRLEGQQFYRPEKIGAKTDTAVMGKILDEKGHPVFGAIAFAYRDTFKKGQPPQYGSPGADADGHYVLYLDVGGDFVIGARMYPKEPPAKGEPLGFHGGRETKLTVIKGQVVEGIDIVIKPFEGTPEAGPGPIPFQK